ncbi:MAG: FeoB-associated Cys-rich membrane protein [Lutibacter sp.]|jgi:hypothetical protein
MQEILVYIALGFAIGFLVKKYILTKKKGNHDAGCDGCH